MKPHDFVHHVSKIKTDNSFNPYSDICSVYDLEFADEIRRELLLSVLQGAFESKIDAIWIGRDLGYRGGRRTGLALTDEFHADAYASRWKLSAVRTTKGQPSKERTASVIWDVLSRIEDNVFLWNVFPLHPHEPHLPFTNRNHNSRERLIGEDVLTHLIEMIKPKRLIAVGNDAVASARKVGGNLPVIKVRHPSYGGQNVFLQQMSELYGIEMPALQKELF